MCSHKVRTRLFGWKRTTTLPLLRNSFISKWLFSRTKQHHTRLPLANTLKSSPGGRACAAQTPQLCSGTAWSERAGTVESCSHTFAFPPRLHSSIRVQWAKTKKITANSHDGSNDNHGNALTPTHFSSWIRPWDWSPQMSLRSTGCLEWDAACKQRDASRIGIGAGGGGGSDRGCVGGWAVTSLPRLQMDHTRVNPQSKCS